MREYHKGQRDPRATKEMTRLCPIPKKDQPREITYCNTLVVKPRTYDPSCDLCSLTLWTDDTLYDCGIFLLLMINLIKDLLLMFDDMTFYFTTIINVSVITRISTIFECC